MRSGLTSICYNHFHMGAASGETRSPGGIKPDQGGPSEAIKPVQQMPAGSGVQKSSSKTLVLPVLIAVMASLAVYFNALYNGFVYDDHYQIEMNPWIRSVKYLPRIFSRNVWSFMTDPTLTPSGNYYRPLTYIMYMFNYYVFGLKPWGFHLIDILFHAGNSALVFLLASRLFKDTYPQAAISPPFIAALFFAVHPIHSEAVTWVACFPEVSFTFFFLLSLYLYIRSGQGKAAHKSFYLLSVVCFFLSAFCKETALTLPAILVVCDYALLKDKNSCPVLLKRYVPFALAAAAYLVVRLNAIGAIVPAARQYSYLSPYQYFINIFPLFMQYIEKLFLPIRLNAFHVLHPLLSLAEPRGILALTMTATFIFFVLVSRKNDGIIFLSLSLIAIPLLPALYIPALGKNTFAERYLYLPSAGWAVLFAMLYSRSLKKMPRHGAAIIVIVTLLAGLCSVQTILRNRVWKNDLLLFTDTVNKSPDAEAPHGWLGFALMTEGRNDEAIAQFREALKINRYAVRYHRFLGRLLLKKGVPEEAISHYRIFLSTYPNDLEARQELADAYAASGMPRIKTITP